MRLEWPVYVFTACVFLAFALGVQFRNLGTGALLALALLLGLFSAQRRVSPTESFFTLGEARPARLACGPRLPDGQLVRGPPARA